MQKVQKRLNLIQKNFLLGKRESVYQWAAATGIPYASLNDFFNFKSYLNVHNLEKLCEAADISIDSFLKMGKGHEAVKSK